MTTRRRDSRPTWAIWWLLPILTAAWPLIAFAHYPSDGQAMQFTAGGWIAEVIWLAILTGIAIYLTATHRKTPQQRTGSPLNTRLTDPLGAASKHKSGVTRSQGAERHPRRTDTPAPPA